MKEYRALKVAHGNAVAKQLKEAKKQAELQKADGDPTTYWMVHPDFPDKEDCILAFCALHLLKALCLAM